MSFFLPFVLQKVHHVLHLIVIIFSFIPISLIKILREERQDHPNYRQNSSPFRLCCCISLIGRKLDNFSGKSRGGAQEANLEKTYKLRPEGPKKNVLGDSPPPPPTPLSKGLDNWAPSLSQGADPALILYSISLRHPILII